MAVPPQNFTLDPSVFNDSLYTRMREFWFAGLPPDAKRGNEATAKRWWSGRSAEESAAFDNICREQYGEALETLSPAHIALPPFQSYEEDIAQATTIASPFLNEVRTATAKDPQNGAQTYLSLVLILDQMTRNIYRDPAGLRVLYTHYDRLVFSLRHAASSLTPNPTQHACFAGRPVYQTWFNLPNMHAEHLASQRASLAYLKELLAEQFAIGDEETAQDVRISLKPAQAHVDVVERFGRFPHRNECLGRESTEEEREWLKTGETFGVKQSGDGDGKEKGKEEL